MKKRILTLMGLALVLALCLLAGCTGNGQTETDTDTATETATVPVTETDTETDTETTTETDTGNGAETATATETATETATMDYFESTKIELVEPDTSLVPDMSIAGDGYDIYLLTEGKEWGYRYGCTYLYNRMAVSTPTLPASAPSPASGTGFPTAIRLTAARHGRTKRSC